MALMRWSVLMAGVAACSYPSLPSLTGDGGDASIDAPPYAVLTVEASPSEFLLHVDDIRQTVVTVKNVGGKPSAMPALEVTGLTLATLTFSNSTCTGELAAGASCTTLGTLTGTATGTGQFQIAASASSVEPAMVTLPITTIPACADVCGNGANTNCCASAIVPGNGAGAAMAGTSFLRGYDMANDNIYKDSSFPATVSDFRLDTYEVSVVRFRDFLDAGMGTQQKPPAAGAGAHPKIPGSGWDASWNSQLPANTAALRTAIKCDSTYQTWSDVPAIVENRPINCITWYEAFAFCIWDGGSEQRAFPWSSPAGSLTIDCTYANYNVNNPNGTYCVNGMTGGTIRVANQSSKGDGKFGHADLPGNIAEWTLDWYAQNYPAPCDDCANLTASSGRMIRGGAFDSISFFVRVGHRNTNPPESRFGALGFRCARNP
jgi:sulfatase modifying factor 1